MTEQQQQVQPDGNHWLAGKQPSSAGQLELGGLRLEVANFDINALSPQSWIMNLPLLNQFLTLKESGELRVESGIQKCIAEPLCKITRRKSFEEACNKLRKESRIRIKTRSTYLREVFSVPKSIVKQWTRSMSLVSVPGLYSDLDLESGKYEGGFKVWESTVDLIKFLTEDQSLISSLLHSHRKIKSLELGAGAALASISFLSRLIEDPIFESEYRVHVQDYNWQVLSSLTLLNFAANFPSNYFQSLLESKCLRFFYGDWADFRPNSHYKYDLIMMSEVIYNSDNYPSLHGLLNRHLKREGIIILATKDSYFGLSGGLYTWLEFLDKQHTFKTTKIVKVSTTNIPRSIIIMRRRTS